MNRRIQNLLDMGKLGEDPALDREVVGLWGRAINAYKDACLKSRDPERRLVSVYDTGRVAALALLRAANLRVRAQNHHEMTFTVAGYIGGDDLSELLDEYQDLRSDRNEIEYGWEATVSDTQVEAMIPSAREVLRQVRDRIVELRPAVAAALAAIPDRIDHPSE